MQYIIVSVRDRAADAFGRPAFVPSVGVAIRSFTDEINRAAPDNNMHQHPDDFDLYKLGMYDETNGTFQCHPPEQICIGKQVAIRT